MRGKAVALVTGAVLLSAYFAVALSPLPERWGRSQPQLASLFEAPTFNFDAKYRNGHVLGFEVGAPRDMFSRTLVTTYPIATLDPTCAPPVGSPVLNAQESAPVSVTDSRGIEPLLRRDTVCVRLDSSVLLIAELRDDKVAGIRLLVNHFEGP
jgi:hypothetical protein